MAVRLPTGRRRGITILELMIVVLILSITAALTIPRLKDAIEDQQRREATRQINAYITGAQVMAAERGRPVGIMLERLPSDQNQCTRLYIAEVPPSYSGDTFSARAKITGSGSSRIMTPTNSGILFTLLKVGDTFAVRFDNKGHYYPGQRTATGFVIQAPSSQPASQLPPVNAYSQNTGFRYQIYRQPQRSSVEPLQLPSNVAIDLSLSGMGIGGSQFLYNGNNSPVNIMFSPNGKIRFLTVNGTVGPPLGPVHLLVGRNDQVNAANRTAADANLNDLANFWVAIGNRNGAVSSNNNLDSSGATGLTNKLIFARKLTRTGRSVGGQ